MAVLLQDWRQRRPRRVPFTWLYTEPGEFIDDQFAAHLAAAFPEVQFRRVDASARTATKTYRNFTRAALDDRGVDASLPAPWRTLVEELADEEYRRAVAKLLDQPVADAVDIRLVRHAAGDWLSPHTDRADKLFSHIVYFNPGWCAEWGGCLQILRGEDPQEVYEHVVPALGASVLLARSEHSWHQVGKVVNAEAPHRLSLLVHGLCASHDADHRTEVEPSGC